MQMYSGMWDGKDQFFLLAGIKLHHPRPTVSIHPIGNLSERGHDTLVPDRGLN